MPHAGGQVELKFLLLPEGEDPDSLVRAGGAKAFRDCMDTAMLLSEFMLGELRSRVDLSSADGRSRLAALARPLFLRLPAGVYRELLVKQVAETIGVSGDALERDFEKSGVSPTPPGGSVVPGDAIPVDDRSRRTLIRQAISLVLNFPDIVAMQAEIPDLSQVDQPGARLLHRLLETVAENPQIVPAQLLEQFRDDSEGRHLGRLLGDTPLDTEDEAAAELQDLLQRIVTEAMRKRHEALVSRSSLSSEQRAEVREIEQRLRRSTGNFNGP